jgi:hypothetical protein
MMYNLARAGMDPMTGENTILRHGLKFGDGLEEKKHCTGSGDLIQINVYRIEYRQRIKDLDDGLNPVNLKSHGADGLR